MAGRTKKKASGQPPSNALEVTREGLEGSSGSKSPAFQSELLDQVVRALWLPEWKTEEQKVQAAKAAYDALKQIAPRSELEGMLAAQMLSTHNAAMECLRRSMMEGQTFEGRDHNLKHAAKLLQLYTRQLETLDKHRGKGQQKITVEHVTVEAGGQAIVGNVDAGSVDREKAASAPPRLEERQELGTPAPSSARSAEADPTEVSRGSSRQKRALP